MASWREIERIRKNPESFRALAKGILALGDSLTEWEIAFLISISKLKTTEAFTVRQSEKLLQIRDDLEVVDTVRGFSVERLIVGCFQARLDLSEDDEEWIAALHKSGLFSVKRRAAGRLLRCAAQLRLIESASA